MLCLWFLRQWLFKAPITYDLLPVHLDMGFDNGGLKPLESFFKDIGIGSFHFEETNFGTIAHGPENRGKSPCFVCSLMRRKRLFELAAAYGCNKIALGHNLDDLIETFFLNICYAGEMSTMVPKQDMFKGLITLIRPLALVEKRRIDTLANDMGIPVVHNRCPSAGKTKREEIKALLSELYARDRHIKGNIARALHHVRTEYLLGR